MDMVFCELPCIGKVGVVMEDNDVRRRSVVPRSNLFAPSGEGRICKPHLVEQMLLTAVQPIR